MLVLRGEAGVGKTALLDLLIEDASDCRVVRAAGVESEMELPFAGLHQLCGSMLDRIADLPAPQREALGVAFGLSIGDAPDRFLVGVAILGLLSAVAEDRAFVCVVDDVQWLDRVSAQVLAFVARRLLAESVGLIFAVRMPSDNLELQGLPELSVEGLGAEDARALLDSFVPGLLDDRVRDRILAETHGNPLAIMELARGTTPAEMEFGFAQPSALPMADRIEQEYVRQLQSLPLDTQRLLLVAAVEPVGDVTVLWRAADQLGIDTDAAGPAEAAELVTFGPRVRFRHPLVRSATRRGADVGALRRAHGALADATDPAVDPDRRAWHHAHAAAGPDEAVAAELERAADRAQRRGGVVAAAAFLQRATELTPDPSARGVRAIAAGTAKLYAVEPESGLELAATAELCPLSEFDRARLERLRASLLSQVGRGQETPELLFEAARRLEPLDSLASRGAYLGAIGTGMYRGRVGGGEAVRGFAAAARQAPGGPTPPRTIDLLLDGLATRFTDGYDAGFAPLRSAMRACERDPGGEEHVEWAWFAPPLAPEVWDDEAWDRLSKHLVVLARDAGVLNTLPMAIDSQASCRIQAGDLAGAAALIEEADMISDATGVPRTMTAALELGAWRGHETSTISAIDGCVEFWSALGYGRFVGLGEYARAVLYNGHGRYDAALVAARQACAYEDLGWFGWSLVELVEAAERSGATNVAAAALEQLEGRTRFAGTDWALGMLARSSALLSDGDAAEASYVEAIERLERTRIAAHLARARLVYGEWLRRANRRVEARKQLRDAYESLTHMGIDAFAERARHELAAAGERARQRTAETRIALTPQETQIARLAGERRTNPEIGAQLFISPRTVEYHLAKVFTKLGISSRKELQDALAELGQSTATA